VFFTYVPVVNTFFNMEPCVGIQWARICVSFVIMWILVRAHARMPLCASLYHQPWPAQLRTRDRVRLWGKPLKLIKPLEPSNLEPRQPQVEIEKVTFARIMPPLLRPVLRFVDAHSPKWMRLDYQPFRTPGRLCLTPKTATMAPQRKGTLVKSKAQVSPELQAAAEAATSGEGGSRAPLPASAATNGDAQV
jgi:hypothetical protein